MSANYIQVKTSTPIYNFECREDAKAVILNFVKNHVYDLTSIPRSVEHICFGDNFNQKIEQNVLPAGLHSIEFGDEFNQLIEIN